MCLQNVLFDLPKLAFQSITLETYLHKGFPIPVIGFYAALLSVNWLISFYRFQRTSVDSSMVVARLFYSWVSLQSFVSLCVDVTYSIV